MWNQLSERGRKAIWRAHALVKARGGGPLTPDDICLAILEDTETDAHQLAVQGGVHLEALRRRLRKPSPPKPIVKLAESLSREEFGVDFPPASRRVLEEAVRIAKRDPGLEEWGTEHLLRALAACPFCAVRNELAEALRQKGNIVG